MADIFLPDIDSTEEEDYFLGLFVNPLDEKVEQDLNSDCTPRLQESESNVEENELSSDDNNSKLFKEVFIFKKPNKMKTATDVKGLEDLYYDFTKGFTNFKMDLWTDDNKNNKDPESSNNQNDFKSDESTVDENVNPCPESSRDTKTNQNNESKDVDNRDFASSEITLGTESWMESNTDEKYRGEHASNAVQASNENEISSKGDDPKDDLNEEAEVSSELNVDIDDDLYCPPPSANQLLSDLESLADSEFIHHRQLAVKKLLDYLQRAGNNQEYLQSVISVMCKLSEDEESMVRSELVQHIPSIALFCQGHSSELKRVIRQQLVPYTVKLLNDSQIGVRKLGQSALLVLLEDGLIDQSQLSEWICPLIAQLAVCTTNSEELRTEDAAVMSKMIPLVGRDMTVKFFLEPYISLCCDKHFVIRKYCALGFGILCRVVGPQTTELSLLPAFLNLCNDAIWSVRRACVEVFVDVATSISPKTKEEVLLAVYLNLLNDTSHFVKYFAYKSLGEFICTFADPAKTGFIYKDGKLSRLPSQAEPSTSETKACPSSTNRTDVLSSTDKREFKKSFLSDSFWKKIQKSQPKSDNIVVATKDEHVFLHIDNTENVFNNFQFWRTPLPEVELDIDIDGGKATNIHIRAKVPGSENMSSCTSEIKVHIAADGVSDSSESEKNASGNKLSRMQVQTACINTITPSSDKQDELEVFKTVSSSFKEAVLMFKDSQVLDIETNTTGVEVPSSSAILPKFINYDADLEEMNKVKFMSPYDQDIVPVELLIRFLSVVNQRFPFDDVNKQCDDDSIEYCAYSFPALVFTLGRENWPILRKTCEKLAKDTKWVIRKIIASSLHELALILGPEATAQDLLPIFLDLLKDVDEVRVKLIMHLFEFLEQLQPVLRSKFLPLIEEFAKVDNERNWRFRCTVAEQLQPTLELFDSFKILKYFLPIALGYVQDKVSAVRIAAIELIAGIVKRLMKDEETKTHADSLLQEFDVRHRQANKWVWRQMYVLLCEQLAKHESLPKDMYVELVVPKLFTLAWDNIPNVRLAVSRCIATTLFPLGYLRIIEKVNHEQLVEVICDLQNDADEDVRQFVLCLLEVTTRDSSLLLDKEDCCF